jgi:hypothetical protein
LTEARSPLVSECTDKDKEQDRYLDLERMGPNPTISQSNKIEMRNGARRWRYMQVERERERE